MNYTHTYICIYIYTCTPVCVYIDMYASPRCSFPANYNYIPAKWDDELNSNPHYDGLHFIWLVSAVKMFALHSEKPRFGTQFSEPFTNHHIFINFIIDQQKWPALLCFEL